jgi:restriction endonuclease S subunit/predicted ATPase
MSRWELPKNWMWAKAHEISHIVGGGTPRTADATNFADKGGHPWLTPADLSNYKGEFIAKGARSLSSIGLENSGAQVLPAGTVLFTSRAPIGYCVIAANPIATSQGFKNLVPKDGISPEYLRYYLLASKGYAESLASGSTFKELSGPRLAELEVPVPPTNEQERIAQLLGELQARCRATTEALEAVPMLLEQFRKATLASAFRGDQTVTWRTLNRHVEPAAEFLDGLRATRRREWEQGELGKLGSKINESLGDSWKSKYQEPEPVDASELPTLPPGWAWTTIDHLTVGHRKISYGVVKPGSHTLDGVRFIKSGQIRNGYIDLSEDYRISADLDKQYSRTRLEGREVLVNLVGASIGRSAVAPVELAGANVTRAIAVIPAVQGLEQWIQLSLEGPLGQRLLQAKTGGSAQPVLNLAELRRLAVPVPPLTEMQAILERIAAADRYLRPVRGAYEDALENIRSFEQSIMSRAFRGKMLPQDPEDEPAEVLLARIRTQTRTITKRRRASVHPGSNAPKGLDMKQVVLSSEALLAAFKSVGLEPDARRLFEKLGLESEQVGAFYEVLRESSEVRTVFENAAEVSPRIADKTSPGAQSPVSQGHFRLVELWLEDFKNLKDYTVKFDVSHGLDVMLGWNGTGKSNLFEALVIIFRDLHGWWERDKWPQEPMKAYRLRYTIDSRTIEVAWDLNHGKRPTVKEILSPEGKNPDRTVRISRTSLPLPRFVFGYYSGPTNRLAEHFRPMKQAHYHRLRTAASDDPETLATLLEQRRFFCAETHHAKYVLLAFCHKEDQKISQFLDERLRIIGFESALFVIRKPRWARKGSTPEDFWGAEGVMRRVMERLRRFAIAPMVLEQTVTDGYRTTREDHYYFFIPDVQRLHAFAAEYDNARTFFVALESTDFSELIHDVRIQVRVKATTSDAVSITFQEMSEGEQQLLMVLGLMRFTKSNQSLILLDEPDTHLNPHWSVDYLKLLMKVMSEDGSQSDEQQSSQILMSTHDPLVIASLVKEQVHLLRRDSDTGICRWTPASVNPRGLGFTGILTSEMFGFRSDLDEETLADLDNKVRLSAIDGDLTSAQEQQMHALDIRLDAAGFTKAFSDPYYAAFVRAWGKRHANLMANQQFLSPRQAEEVDRVAREVLEEAIAEVQQENEV